VPQNATHQKTHIPPLTQGYHRTKFNILYAFPARDRRIAPRILSRHSLLSKIVESASPAITLRPSGDRRDLDTSVPAPTPSYYVESGR
jgi:hypothetical protein